MKFFADHCFFAKGTGLLKEYGYDILTAKEAGIEKFSDTDIAAFCHKENKIILTLDRDFESLTLFPLGTHKGIVVFRCIPFTPDHLTRMIQAIHQKDLFPSFKNALAIITNKKVRVVKPGRSTETF